MHPYFPKMLHRCFPKMIHSYLPFLMHCYILVTEIGHRAPATDALFSMGAVLGPYGPYRGEVHDLTGLSPERWKLCQGRPAIPAILRAQVHHMVRMGHHFQGVPFAPGPAPGLTSRFLAKAP